MLHLFRPYKNMDKSIDVLLAKHKAMMKLNSYLIAYTISVKMGWLEEKEGVDLYKQDPFVLYYYNNGKPYMKFLLEYYTTSYIAWLKEAGEICDFIDEIEKAYKKHKEECAHKEKWKTSNAVLHRLWLLRYDYKWYKRHFRKYMNIKLLDYNFFDEKGKPRSLKKFELIGELRNVEWYKK